MAGYTDRTGTSSPDGPVREGRAGADVGALGRALPGHPAGRPPATHAAAHRAEAVGHVDRRPAGGPRPVPPRSRSALDRSDGGPSGLSGRGGPVVSAAHLAEASEGGPPILEARDVQLSFGATPA